MSVRAFIGVLVIALAIGACTGEAAATRFAAAVERIAQAPMARLTRVRPRSTSPASYSVSRLGSDAVKTGRDPL